MKKNNTAAPASQPQAEQTKPEKPKLASKKQFAELNGWSPGYVTKLANQQRLVMRGKLVDVAESLALIEQTAGSRHDVGMRHQENRAKKTKAAPAVANDAASVAEKAAAVASESETAQQTTPQPEAEQDDTILIDKEAVQAAHRRKVMADMRRAESLAEKEHLELQKLAGRLVELEHADLAMRMVGATIRSLLDVFPGQVAPLVAPVSSIEECNSILAEQCRNVLLELSETLRREQGKLQRAKP